MTEDHLSEIAIIGVHGRFPGANSVEALWRELLAGNETVSTFSKEELAETGIDPDSLHAGETYVPARGMLEDAELFDAAFFGIHPKEAEVMDPQHRIFLEGCWEALERAGYSPGRISFPVGVYAGASFNTYYLHALHDNVELQELVGRDQVMLGNEKDYLATRVAYKLNLKGPAISFNTACSSSLVAICQASQALLTYQCDMALAGGISVTVPQKRGYVYQEGNIGSPDGHTRTFDADAQGTVFSNGMALVVLKRMDEAIRDGDNIVAVIKGFALNNDGSRRVSFGAPGVDGQSEVIAMAQAVAGVDPESITYVEAHGTATPVGDPIEVAALNRAFRLGTDRKQFCALGALKSNLGHLDSAAGAAGLIKSSLCLSHRKLVPTLHYTRPNSGLDLENSPFYVNTETQDWSSPGDQPLRAGVSSFGTGGTNAHIVLEEYCRDALSSPSRQTQLLILSAKTPEALENASIALSESLRSDACAELADVAYTLQVGRAEFAHRRSLVCESTVEAREALKKGEGKTISTGKVEFENPPVVFMFPGQGAQYAGMGAGLYKNEPVFREEIDRLAEVFQASSGSDIRELLFPAPSEKEKAEAALLQTRYTQPALFAIEYALSKLLMSWGIHPSCMIGHSVGEYAAGCLAGVFSPEDALNLVSRRAELIQEQPHGSMLAVRMPEEELASLITPSVSIAAVNSPKLCVVSGPDEAISDFDCLLKDKGVAGKRLRTSHAFHSDMMEPVLDPFLQLLSEITLREPELPFVSNVTADWITKEEATSPGYWAGHVRQTVRFAAGIGRILESPEHVFLEVGPGQTLSQMARQHTARPANQPVVSSITQGSESELTNVLTALGKLWSAGVTVDWNGFYERERRKRVVLPTYPFARTRFWPAANMHMTSPPHSLAVDRVPDRQPEAETTPAHSRKDGIVASILSLLESASGTPLVGTDSSVEFLELGLDSLLLTHAATLVQRKFGIPVSFRQLMDELSTVESLASYLDDHLPDGAGGQGVRDSLIQPAAQSIESPAREPASGASPPEKGHGPFRQMRRRSKPMTGAKLEFIDSLVARYTKRTAGSKRMAAENRSQLADPRSVSGFRQEWKEMVYPIYVDRSDGSRVWDVDGNEYIDFVMGFGASLFGHRPRFLVDSLKSQLDEGFEIGPIQPAAGEVAALVRELTGAERVAFCSTGSEAVLAAMRIARTVTGRDRIVMFSGAYHGIFDEVLARPQVLNGEFGAAPIAPGIPAESLSQIMVLEYDDPESLNIIRRHADELAAVLVEPVQSRQLDVQPKAFLQELRQITRECGTALVFDEIVTGFRIEAGGAQSFFGVDADLVSYGKVIGGGFPLGLLTGKSTFMDALDGGAWQYGDNSFPEKGVTFFAGTFVRHPLALAAARAVLTHLKTEGPALQRETARKAEEAAERLREIFDRAGVPCLISQFSSLMNISLSENPDGNALFYYQMRDRGIHIWENRVFVFTTAHSKSDINNLVEAAEDSLRELRLAGLVSTGLPRASLQGKTASHGDLPLSEAQKELWLTAALSDLAFRAYSTTFVIRLIGELDRKALEESFRDLVVRHDSLRTSFDREEPIQTIHPDIAFNIPYEDLGGRGSDAAEEHLKERAGAEATSSFELDCAPLFRVELFRIGTGLHALLITTHHLVTDGWSMGVFFHELQQLYQAHRSGTPCCLEPPLQFSAYIELLDSEAIRDSIAEAEMYWTNRFSTLPPQLDLPADRIRIPERSFGGARASVTWDKDFTLRLRRAAARQRVTLLSFLLAGFKSLAFRLSGTEDLVIGVPAAAQISPALQSREGSRLLTGHCVNLLPVRSRCEGKLSFSEYSRLVQDALLDAYEHQSLSFGQLLQVLRMPRNPARQPLVSVMFNLDRAGTVFHLSDLSVTVEEQSRSYLIFDLSVNIIDKEDELRVDCDFNTDLFDAETIRGWLHQFRNLLGSGLDSPNTEIESLQLLDDTGRDKVLRAWNDTEADYPSDQRIEKLVRNQVQRTPDHVAVSGSSGSLSYRALDDRADRLAASLHSNGVEPGQLLGLCVKRTPDMITAVLAILKAGAAYVPLDPDFPAERIAFMIRDADIPFVLTQTDLAPALPEHHGITLCIDELLEESKDEQAPVQVVETGAADLAYVIYTSGSTGTPKGVEISHRSVVNFLWSMKKEPGVDATDRLVSVTTLSFDISVLELFLPLVVGATVVVADRDTASDGRLLGDYIDQTGSTMMQATPATWWMLLESNWKPKGAFKALCGGEALPSVLRNRLLACGVELWNMYGPTETTIWSTAVHIQADDEEITIGRPIDNTQVYILDDKGEPVSPGEVGNLFISGAGVACGYRNSPDLTREKFILNPFAAGDEGVMYDTGDLARHQSDGRIVALGRSDYQVKVRGFRIELGEIEAALDRHESIDRCAVAVVGESAEARGLAAYIVCHGKAPTTDNLMQFLGKALPDYMIPADYIELDAFPLTPNGKVDRKALPEPSGRRSGDEERYRPAETEEEANLVRIWEQLLSARPIGVTDSFFELGGHSLLAMRMAMTIEKEYGKRIPLATLLHSPTIESLARLLQGQTWTPTWSSIVPIRLSGSKPPLYLVHAHGGNVLEYYPLVKSLDPEWPVYGIQARGLDGNFPSDLRIESMAESYVGKVKAMQPDGPYYLAGFCFGGILALEMARQLEALGSRVAFLGLIHSMSKEYDKYLLSGDVLHRSVFRTAKRLHLEWQNLIQTGISYVPERIGRIRDLVYGLMMVRRESRRPPPDRNGTLPLPYIFAKLAIEHDKAYLRYNPISCRCPVTLFPARHQELGVRTDPYLGWKQILTGDLVAHTVPGHQQNMLREPNVRELARVLGESLELSYHTQADL